MKGDGGHLEEEPAIVTDGAEQGERNAHQPQQTDQPLPGPSHGHILTAQFHDRFLRLAKLPAWKKPLRSYSICAAERLAKPDENTLLDVLALPKIGMIPALRAK